ncbi:outer membrane protein assembly factor BamB family protein [Microlunatus ginsengisoli]|uniref:Pyrrolo-quinoline quinone repeat domain-containing protein n=1 Tax=Microlunatus ginsengisoli TaxID=363863 RepID=A0ABP6ZZ76_9ACTN
MTQPVRSAGISTSTDGRWAPFPVQDWSTLPPPGADLGSPAGRPARSRRSRSPLIVILVVLALVAGAIVVANGLGRPHGGSAAIRYVPRDGAVGWAERSSAGAPAEPVVVESARYAAGELRAALDFTLATQVLAPVGGSYVGKDFWRTTTTSATGSDQPQQIRVYALGGDVTLIAESWPGRGMVFDPGVVELPAEVAVGSHWTSSGSAGTDADYAASFSASAAAGECLRVAGELRLTTKTGELRSRTVSDKLWCHDRGIVDVSETADDVTVTLTSTGRIAAPEGISTTPTAPPAWPEAGGWRSVTAKSVSVDPTFGEGPITAVPALLPPVVTAGGRIFRAAAGAEDVVAFAPYVDGPGDPARRWRSLWRLHPGGSVLSVAAFGDVVTVSTSLRQLVGYRDDGVRLWSVDLDELAFAAPVRLSADSLAVVDLAGSVRAVDISSGAVRWRSSTPGDVGTAPVAGAGLVVVADRSGAVSAFDAADGRSRWQLEIDQYLGAAPAGDAVLLVGEQTVQAVAPADGRRRWMRPYRGTFRSISAAAGGAVLTGRTGSQLLTADGRARDLPRSYAVVTAEPGTGPGRRFVGWADTRADLLDADGTVLAGREIPPLSVVDGQRLVAADRTGVLLATQTWDWLFWGAPPG